MNLVMTIHVPLTPGVCNASEDDPAHYLTALAEGQGLSVDDAQWFARHVVECLSCKIMLSVQLLTHQGVEPEFDSEFRPDLVKRMILRRGNPGSGNTLAGIQKVALAISAVMKT